MPLSLYSLSRRRFLASAAAVGATTLLPGESFASQEGVDPNFVALMADTHIPSASETNARGVNMAANLQAVLAEIAEREQQPAWSLINGDCAYLTGLPEDYRLLVELLRESRAGGMTFHMTMGNHDRREQFWEAIPSDHREDASLNQRHLTVVEGPRANWFLLDSLVEGEGAGRLGATQRQWLSDALDARPEQPALLAFHHNLTVGEIGDGLLDIDNLMEVIGPREQVKGVFFGHSHLWQNWEREGIHMVNLPPVSYVFREGAPNGWVSCQLEEEGMTLQIHTLDPQHANQGDRLELAWR